MTHPPLLRVRALRQSFGRVAALDTVSLDVPRGAFVVLLGPSGSGKTTLLNVLGGFVMPDAGSVEIDGRDVTLVPPARRPTTTVFQDYALFPHMSVGANVEFGLAMRRIGRAERRRRAHEALAMVGLEDMAARKPHALSGGQRQRVALARALVVEPLLLLLDEPLGALDLKLRRLMQDELKRLQKRVGTTFVHVTHDQEEAMALADLLIVMNQGRIEDRGPPERVYSRPASLFAAEFMGEVTRFPALGVAEAGELDTPVGRLAPIVECSTGEPRSGAPLGPGWVVVRPEDIAIGEPLGGRQSLGVMTVSEVVYQGAYKRLIGEIGTSGAPLPAIVRTAATTAAAVGAVLPICAPANRLLVFPRS